MKDKILLGGLVEICPQPCEHRLCNDVLLKSLLGINPFENERNKRNIFTPVQPENLEADNGASASAVRAE